MNYAARQNAADQIINEYGYKSSTFYTEPFSLFSAAPHNLIQDNVLHVVIEGDGYAWANYRTPSDNPTPLDPAGLRIATEHGAIYLARPCQYILNNSKCHHTYWTARRFSAEIINSYNDALTALKQKYGNKTFHLSGYSGGAYIALIMAATRNDIESVTTIAGLIDPKQWTDFHDVSPLALQYDTPALLQKTKNIPFKHWCGTKDDVVPCGLTENTIRGLSNHQLVRIPGANHKNIWDKLPANDLTR